MHLPHKNVILYLYSLAPFTALAVVATLGCQPAAENTQESPSKAAQEVGSEQVKQAAPIDITAIIADPDFKEWLGLVFTPLPKRFDGPNGVDSEAMITLGRKLFFDKRLSKNHDISCNSCHGLTQFGVDNKKFSPGHKGQLGGRNSPTVYNSAPYFAQFWDGRAANLTEQAKGPILNPVEMAMPNEARVVKTLKSIPGYVKAFKKAFPKTKGKKSLTYHNMAEAIAAFERGLVTPSRFDKFLQGDSNSLTHPEKEGLVHFYELGCSTCHNGPAIGGSGFQRIGQVVPYDDTSDLGRFAVTKNPADKLVFKVPSLRNIAKTAPYFHNGRFDTLEETVVTMAKHQLGKTLKPTQITTLVALLNSFTGELPTDYIKVPQLPKSGAHTPKPDPR